MFDPRTQSPIANPNPANWQLQFRAHNPSQESAMESDNSGANSPPLWKTSPSPSHPLLTHHGDRLSLSPNSRTQAIARGQWELMEMVKNMPESSYELSLKDLVEHHRSNNNTAAAAASQPPNHSRSSDQTKQVKMKRQESCSKSAVQIQHRGLFLNVVFPFSMKSRNRVKVGSNNNINMSNNSNPDGERDWWKKKMFTGSSDSDSSRTTTASGSGSSTSTAGSDGDGHRKKNGSLTGCWPFLQSRKH